jgi:aromatic ring-opening dioxygenase catalytic subunit (LigB family)
MSEIPATTAMPSLFIPHGGGPCFFMDWRAMGGPADAWDKTAAYLKGLIASLPQRPKGIVVISGHWEEDAFTASTAAAPAMIYDYYGFPPHTYELQFPPLAPRTGGTHRGPDQGRRSARPHRCDARV